MTEINMVGVINGIMATLARPTFTWALRAFAVGTAAVAVGEAKNALDDPETLDKLKQAAKDLAVSIAIGTAVIESLRRSRSDETLWRYQNGPESLSRLIRKADEAEGEMGIHGVSAFANGLAPWAGRRRVVSLRSTVSQVFEVLNTRLEPHRTVVLPKPVTAPVRDLFNALWVPVD